MRIERLVVALIVAPLCACSATPPAVPHLSAEEAEARIVQGRALLDAGRPVEAEAVFAAAAAADGDSLRTRMWVLRAWMDQGGRSNDTLDALDALDRAGEKGLEMTYLYGMAFARRAQGYVADNVGDSSVQMNFIDAADRLERAVRADPVRYHDAFLPLADAAWYVEKPELARWAADHAVELQPSSPEAWLLRGRIALAQFGELATDEPTGPAAEATWAEAAASFQHALERFDTPDDARAARELADAATQLGHTLLWKQKGPEATEAYATAMAWNPEGFPYPKAYDLLRALPKDPEDERPSGFRAALELGRTRFEEHAGPADPQAGTLLWWLGWARFIDAEWAGSEEAFQAALARGQRYSNGWFYVGLARQYRKDSEGALQAMHAGWDADPAAMVAVIASAGGSLRAFENLLGWCASQEPPRNADAAFLSEMLSQSLPDEPRYWNNLGLFLRDQGEQLEFAAHKKKEKADRKVLDELYARSFAAYERSLGLVPDDPQLLNDTALMLIYHVGPDYPRAETMFRRAIELTEQRLAATDLPEEDRARFEQTRTDAKENLQRMLDHLAGKDEPEADESADDSAKDAQPDGADAPKSPSGGGR